MAGNTFGDIFNITTWGESHGKALGVIIDGCPAGLALTEKDIQVELDKRKPSKSKASTTRKEDDKVKILSGVFEGKTTGTPLSMIVFNHGQKSKDYSKLKDIYRPGHADLTYDLKYGIRDYRGGGRSSGRETVARVMAGAVAKKILKKYKVDISGYAVQIGEFDGLSKKLSKKMENEIDKYLMKLKREKDSCGGVVEIIVKKCPAGLGEPVFDKIEADLAKAIMSIGSVKGVEFGTGFECGALMGSEQNDEYEIKNGKVKIKTNNAGGMLGGITNGENLVLRFAVKPPASIGKKQMTVNKRKKQVNISIDGRHDVCIVPRIIPVAESMVAIILVDHLLKANV